MGADQILVIDHGAATSVAAHSGRSPSEEAEAETGSDPGSGRRHAIRRSSRRWNRRGSRPRGQIERVQIEETKSARIGHHVEHARDSSNAVRHEGGDAGQPDQGRRCRWWCRRCRRDCAPEPGPELEDPSAVVVVHPRPAIPVAAANGVMVPCTDPAPEDSAEFRWRTHWWFPDPEAWRSPSTTWRAPTSCDRARARG